MTNTNELYRKPIEEEKGLFSFYRVYRFLWGRGIYTVGELLDNKERIFNNGVLSADERVGKEITLAIKLLECKYLGIDPKIEITSEDSMETIGDKLEFSTKTKTAFVDSVYRNNRRCRLTPEAFINIIKNSSEIDARGKLSMIKGFGEVRINEVYYRSSIVINYDKNNDLASSYGEELTREYFDLLAISKDVKKLDSEIDSRLDAILDIMATEGLLTNNNLSKHIK